MTDQIYIHPATGTVGKGNWQAIGYIDGKHVSSFGYSPVDALEKALFTTQKEEEDVWS